MSETGTSATFDNLGAEILADVKTAWADVEDFGKEALAEVGVLATNEYNALKGAAISVLGEFVPKQVALIQTWVTQYKTQVASGATLLGAAEYCLAMDASSETSFLAGELTLGLQTLSGAFLNAL